MREYHGENFRFAHKSKVELKDSPRSVYIARCSIKVKGYVKGSYSDYDDV